jgi:hypothetical protein
VLDGDWVVDWLGDSEGDGVLEGDCVDDWLGDWVLEGL